MVSHNNRIMLSLRIIGFTLKRVWSINLCGSYEQFEERGSISRKYNKKSNEIFAIVLYRSV